MANRTPIWATEYQLARLDGLCLQAKEKRKTIFGADVPSSRARHARDLLGLYAPFLLRDIRTLLTSIKATTSDAHGNETGGAESRSHTVTKEG